MYVRLILLLLKCVLEVINLLSLDVEKKAAKDGTGDFLSDEDALSFGDLMYFRHEIEAAIKNYELQNKLRYED